MKNENDSGTDKMTRRTVISAGLASALTCLAPHAVLASATKLTALIGDKPGRNRTGVEGGLAGNLNDSNLYVFPGAQAGNTVIAVTWLSRGSRPSSEVRLHSGSQKWIIPSSGSAKPQEWEQGGCQFFTGSIRPAAGQGESLDAAVIEVPSHRVSNSASAGVWAELLVLGASRQRIGSPFVSEIVSGNRALARLYHSTSPTEDRVELMQGLAKAIAAKARSAGYVRDPEAHGRRLASILLPDVIYYASTLPPGFTFAAQNGRHPEEVSAAVVNTILTGFATSAPVPNLRLKKTFPYFRPSAAA
jgi:hypothetical protein